MIHFKDLNEILNILRDVQAYIYLTRKNDELGDKIYTRVTRILDHNEEINTKGDNNEKKKQTRKITRNK